MTKNDDDECQKCAKYDKKYKCEMSTKRNMNKVQETITRNEKKNIYP